LVTPTPLLAMSAEADSVLTPLAESSVLLHEAVGRYHRAGLRHDEAQARLMLAAALLAAGDATGAGEQISAASALLSELSDAAALAHAHRLARSLPARSPHPLTPREVEVLRLVSLG
jgi:DNA-binding NarL/FixJ family response regulator